MRSCAAEMLTLCHLAQLGPHCRGSLSRVMAAVVWVQGLTLWCSGVVAAAIAVPVPHPLQNEPRKKMKNFLFPALAFSLPKPHPPSVTWMVLNRQQKNSTPLFLYPRYYPSLITITIMPRFHTFQLYTYIYI